MLPVYKTKRLILRQRCMDDFLRCLEMDKCYEVTKFIPGVWDGSEAHIRFLKKRFIKTFPSDLGYWSIFSKDDSSQFLGWIFLIPYDTIDSKVEIGWRLNKISWGKGYATEAAHIILKHAFTVFKTNCLVADIHSKNSASVRVAEKIGLTFFTDCMIDNNIYKSYRLTRNKYLEAKS